MAWTTKDGTRLKKKMLDFEDWQYKDLGPTKKKYDKKEGRSSDLSLLLSRRSWDPLTFELS